MKILGVDTSCDETSIGIIEVRSEKKIKLLSNIVSSQVRLHSKYGGVYPSLAKRKHQENLAIVLKKALKKASLLKKGAFKKEPRIETLRGFFKKSEILFERLKNFLERYEKPKIDLLAVCIGPGLEPCLWQGINFAKALSYFWKIPIVKVNHLEAHILINFLKEIPKDIFPSICLLVSGGHTELFLMEKIGKYKILGETLDDAAGECLDKTARILGLSYPGGPQIEKLAKKAKDVKYKIDLPRPMIHQKNFNFSFSGLKTAVLYKVRDLDKKLKREDLKAAIANEIQESIFEVLIKKTIDAAKKYGAKAIFLGGGVVANKKLKEIFKKEAKKNNFKIFFPKKEFCLDNGAMIGLAGYFGAKRKKISWKKLRARPNLKL